MAGGCTVEIIETYYNICGCTIIIHLSQFVALYSSSWEQECKR